MRRAIVLVALALVAASCSNGGGGSTADKAPEPTERGGLEQRKIAEGGGDAMAPTPTESPETTATANGQQVTGRQLLQASRARFTRPLPTVVPTPVTSTVAAPTTTPPTTAPPGGTLPTDPPAASEEILSQELIAKALAQSEITYAQSLLYRAYALFWDPRLPERFDGIGSSGEDDFFTEARLRFGELDADTQAKLAPFLERPAAADGYGCPLTDNGVSVSWIDSGSASTHFKVWACATNGAAEDIDTVVAHLDALYPGMTDPAAMGPPVPDTGGGDPRIDVYLLDVVPTRERNGTQRPIDGLTIAGVSADAPFVGDTASSYLMLGRPRVGDQRHLRRTLAHEFFHSLEYAHNYAITTTKPGLTPWFFEAAAAWAEWQFVPAAAASVHSEYFTSGFRTAPDLPLEIPTRAGPGTEQAHTRWAYLWPFFMQQEAGGDPAAVFATWDAVEGAATWNDFHAAVDTQQPFETSFRDFTVRNLNLDFGPAFEPLYNGLDPDFPVNAAPTLHADDVISQPGTMVQPIDGLHSLSTQYDFAAIGGQSNTNSLTLDFAGVPTGIDVTVLTHVTGGGWTRHDLAPADVLTFDFATGGAVDQFYVILGNHDREPDWEKPGGAELGGSYTLTAAS